MQRREFIQVLAAAPPVRGLCRPPPIPRTPTNLPHPAMCASSTPATPTPSCCRVYYREPSSNLGVGAGAGRPPHIVGDRLLAHYGIEPGSSLAYVLAHTDFAELAARFGAVGGFAHIATLVRAAARQRAGRRGPAL